ncbi:MAG TPA: LEA type 2 family protein [Phycisphaerales bacterium]|nr:LEA type 2 family protein [Phycisphaerales bacterium]
MSSLPNSLAGCRSLALIAAAIVAGVLSGCSGAAPPRATVSDARIRDRSPEAAVVEFAVEATNPNDIELPLRDITYSVSIDGRQVFSGRREAMATIPRGGAQRVYLPAVIPMGGAGTEPGVHRYTLRGRMRYSLPSQLADVLFDAKISRPGVSFSDEGEIDLR